MSIHFNKYKNLYVGVLLTILGTLTLIGALYAPLGSSFLLFDEAHDLETRHYILGAFGLLALLGGIRQLTFSLRDYFKRKIDNN